MSMMYALSVEGYLFTSFMNHDRLQRTCRDSLFRLTPFSASARRYDSHRDQILKSGDRHQAGGSGFGDGGSAGGGRPDDEEDLFAYFSTSCFSGYGDGAKVRRSWLAYPPAI